MELVPVEETKDDAKGEQCFLKSLKFANAIEAATIGVGKRLQEIKRIHSRVHVRSNGWSMILRMVPWALAIKWEMNYWQNGEGTALGVSTLQRRTVLAFPSVPETKMFAKKASVDCVWPSHTGETSEQSLE